MPKIHRLSEVMSSNIGAGTAIWQYSIVLAGARIGRNCNINSHCFVENDVIIGDNVTLKCGVYVWDGITIEDDVFVGPNVTFTNDPYPRSKRHLNAYPRTNIHQGASLGANSTILCGVTVGRHALVGAGSLVSRDVPAHALVFGNPAKLRGYVCFCGHKLNTANECPHCGSTFHLQDSILRKTNT